ncbi:hypothetical protein LCGC14_2853130, partial [marine sediment metagenome]
NRKRDSLLHQKENEINDKYKKLIESEFPKRSLGLSWLFTSGILFWLSAGLLSEIYRIGFLTIAFFCLLAGALPEYFIKSYLNNRDKKSKRYNSLIADRDKELKTLKDKYRNINELQSVSIGNTENNNVSCPHCRKNIGFSPYFIERNLVEGFNRIKCPFCSQEFTCEKKEEGFIDEEFRFRKFRVGSFSE